MIATRNSIPVYQLYGEASQQDIDRAEPEFFHLESIPARSRLHNMYIRPHRHANLFQMLYITRGTADITFDDRQFSLGPHHLLTIPPGTVHGFKFSDDIDGWVISLTDHHLTAILAPAPRLLSHLDAPRSICFGANSNDSPPARGDFLITQLVAEYHGHHTGRLFALRQIIGLLLLDICRQAQLPTQGRLSRQEQKLAKFRKFQTLIERDYRQHKSLEYYAREIGMTTTQLNRIAKDIYDMTATDVVQSRLMLEAKRTLIYTDIAVQQIADDLGFRDAGYFSRFFTKKAGISPARFRASHR
ncbi:MAG: helix-turn-helix domain-containing protein [Pseudomonadota bacterium]